MPAYFEDNDALAAVRSRDFDAPTSLTSLDSNDSIAAEVTQILRKLGEDPNREGLLNTPKRVDAALRFLTEGYRKDLTEIVNGALFESSSDDMVLVKDIEIFSMCEHHILPIWGKAHIAYIPNGSVLGLSKLPRIADVYARRLQLQERMTTQIADAIDEVLKPRGIAVITDCRHMCMMMRGVQKNDSSTVCREFRGAFKTDDSLRRDLMSMIDLNQPL